MEGAALLLPRPSDLSGPLRRFVAERLGSQDDLSRSPNLTVELCGECSDLEASLDDLDRRLSESIAAYASHAEEVGGRLGEVRAGLIDLRSSIAGPSLGTPFQYLASRFIKLGSSICFFGFVLWLIAGVEQMRVGKKKQGWGGKSRSWWRSWRRLRGRWREWRLFEVMLVSGNVPLENVFGSSSFFFFFVGNICMLKMYKMINCVGIVLNVLEIN